MKKMNMQQLTDMFFTVIRKNDPNYHIIQKFIKEINIADHYVSSQCAYQFIAGFLAAGGTVEEEL